MYNAQSYYNNYLAAKEQKAKYEKNKALLEGLISPIQTIIDNITKTSEYANRIILGSDPVDENLLITMKGNLETAIGLINAMITESNTKITELETMASQYYSMYQQALNQENNQEAK